jgi:hypothetical protein
VVVNERTVQVIEDRKARFPERPLIRISSTFFWHLSSDYDLAPIPALAEEARRVRAEQFRLGRDEGEEAEYPPIKVGEQVSKYVIVVLFCLGIQTDVCVSELKHIALMA